MIIVIGSCSSERDTTNNASLLARLVSGIVYDVHQQGSNGSRFFIPPFFDPPNPNIDPLLLRQVDL